MQPAQRPTQEWLQQRSRLSEEAGKKADTFISFTALHTHPSLWQQVLHAAPSEHTKDNGVVKGCPAATATRHTGRKEDRRRTKKKWS
mmetsp:Transcript_5086/g.12140  ORF Transcript_5086/g.12140 Transcript_5086/m.12140 type:complete len:87 (+) Transcript_5086:222-482(+)